MKYGIGGTGRVAVVRFEDGDDVLENIAMIALREDIRSAAVYLVGGMKGGRFVVGPETEEMPPVPVWRELTESHEILAIGTVFRDEADVPRVHMHGAFGKRDSVKVGCVREKSETFLVLEAILQEIVGVDAVRRKDPATGLSLLEIR